MFDYKPEKDNTALYINELVEAMRINEPYLFGRPREYDLAEMFKLVGRDITCKWQLFKPKLRATVDEQQLAQSTCIS